MIVKQLQLTNVRVFREVEFNFQTGMNLLVGVNGVGKSTVLDVLRILFSGILQEIPHYDKQLKFGFDDLKKGTDCLSAELSFKISQTEQHKYLIKKHSENYPFKTVLDRVKAESLADGIYTEDISDDKFISLQEHSPLAIFFSPHRSILNTTKSYLKNNKSPAHAEALEPRQLSLKQFIDWWQARKKLAEEGLGSGQTILNALGQAVTEFLGCSNLHVDEKKKTLLIEKSGVTLDVKQLSDGERGVLALVLDLTKRLAQANPYLENPAKEGKGVVLIDELDLHLHPKWQRTIVDQLTRTFPNCQFIATTHSPQIIGSVAPENVILLEHGKPPLKPDQSLGMDTNWILKFLMETNERDSKYELELKEIAQLIEDDNYEEAQSKIDSLREKLGEFPELVRLQTRIDRFTLLDL